MSNIRSSIRVIAAAALAFACAAPAIAQFRAEGGAASTPATTTTSFERHVTRVGDREIIIEIRDGEVTVATIDGEPIPVENITQLGDGAFQIDQAGDAPDIWFNVRSGRPEGAARSQIVVVGPHGEPMTFNIPDWTAQAEAERQLVQRGFAFTPTEQLSDQPPPKVMIGVQLSAPGAELAGHLGLNPDETTLIAAVYPNLPAAKAGLAQYDIIVAIDGQRPAGSEALREGLADAEPGDTLKLAVLHQGQERQVEITLAAWDEEALSQAAPGAMRDKELREAFRLAETLRPGVGAWAGENGAATFTFPSLRERAATARALEQESMAMAERMEQVEQQLQRVEELLNRLVEQEQGSKSPPAPTPPGPPALPHDGFNRWELRA